MDTAHLPLSAVVGLPVLGPFGELSRLVPAAWQQLEEMVGRNADENFVELSTQLRDGRYHEVVGVLREAGTAAEISRPGMVTVLVPPGEWLSAQHGGPRETIAEGFDALIAEAQRLGRTPSGEKLDIGYRLDGAEESHELRIRLLPASRRA